MDVLCGVMMTVHPGGRCNKHRFTAPSLCYTTCQTLLRLTAEYKVIKYLSFVVKVDNRAVACGTRKIS
jgi:hypothetical protein